MADNYTPEERRWYNKQYKLNRIAEDPGYRQILSDRSKSFYHKNREVCLAKQKERYRKDKEEEIQRKLEQARLLNK